MSAGTSESAHSDAPRVAIVGGGLAGLAAAVALVGSGGRVELFETRRTLGGRAGSYRDPATDEWIDHCQHVSMGCCTNLADFCARTGLDRSFRRDSVLHFIGPDGRKARFQQSRWLPAPLHLVAGLLRLPYLTAGEKWQIARGVLKLVRTPATGDGSEQAMGAWLRACGQSPRAIERFWSVILTSALGEEVDRASYTAARKVFVDGFLAARDAYHVQVPTAPLGTVYGEQLTRWLEQHAAIVHLSAPVERVCVKERPMVVLSQRGPIAFDHVILAVPWNKLAGILGADIAPQLPWLAGLTTYESSPITAVHLWFDRPITQLPHSVIVGRLSQWIFARPDSGAGEADSGSAGEHHYQIVISASRGLACIERHAIVEQVCDDLHALFPPAREAQLVRARVVTQADAVFSPGVGLDALRPTQQTGVPGIYVAGDWTATGWPATMESAVRGGYLAAEAVAKALGRPRTFLVPDLRRGLLARFMIRA